MNGVITTPLQFGLGDGVTSQFELTPNPGTLISSVVKASIYRNDWQGNQLLYATPRTNFIIQSQAFDSASWTKSNTTVSANVVAAPDGTLTADKIVESTANSIHDAIQIPSVAGLTAYTFLVFLKAAERIYANIIIDGTGGNFSNVYVNLSTGTIVSGGAIGGFSGYSSSLTAVGSGWYCVVLTSTTAASTTNLQCQIRLNNGTSDTYTGDGSSGLYAWGADLKTGNPSSYIPTTTASVTVTDYTLSPGGLVTLANVPVSGAEMTWTGMYIYTPTAAPSNFPLNTVLSQYANSPILVQLIQNLSDCIDPSGDIDAFYQNVWNIDTAVGYGLDVWGRIVGLPNGRILKIPTTEINLGFSEAGTASAAPFGSGVFYSGVQNTQNYSLSDDAFRTLILTKAFANILDGSIPSYNRLLQLLFAGRGRCYVNDQGNMTMRYTFEFSLQPFELAILTQSGILPRPTGVLASIIQVPVPNILGFAEAGTASAAPFGSGTLFNSGTAYAS